MILVSIALASIFLVQTLAQECLPMDPPTNGRVVCPKGRTNGVRCRFECNNGYELEAGSPKNKMCRCVAASGRCFWVGRKQPVCKIEAAPPVMMDCEIPDYTKAFFDVSETWATGAILKVSVMPTVQANGGWSVVLEFAKSMPAGIQITSGHVKLVGTGNDRRHFTFNSMETNQDISDLSIYDFHLSFRHRPSADPIMYSGLVGFYDKLVADGSCIENISPVRPLPTTTTTTTTRRTTTRATTRRPNTTRRPTAATPVQSASDGCEVLNDPNQPGYLLLNNGWAEGNDWIFSARFEKHPAEGEVLNDWVFKAEFSEKVDDIEIFAAVAEGGFENGRVWLIRPRPFNQISRNSLQLNFLGTIVDGSSGPTAYITFCRNGALPDTGLSFPEVLTPPTVRPPPNRPGTYSMPQASTEPSIGFSQNCLSDAPNSFGNLPSRSTQTDPSEYNPSTYYSPLIPRPPGSTAFDYNQVLHLSILFYEAQRSGKLPENNRIGWRGDSGLKDGCDVGLDLTGGFYDAGDNVKFGFPMAYTMTVLAWGMIEFKDAYEDSGDWQATLDILKWGTDYFIKAHPSKYEFYAQVGDAMRDHGEWLRPEDIDYAQISYKLDQNNPGSDVLAETAAALAAASIVFKEYNTGYSSTLLQHAEELYEFADRFRGVYHNSIPGVETYYKSWSGFNDELLWGAIWLHRATGEQSYLDKVKNNYDRYGAGNSPPEFSWDNKYAGVQVLMAQTTKEQKYVNDVRKFYRATQKIKTTLLGLTWKSKWGSNRYAANFAFIFVMAAEVVDLSGDEEMDYIAYAISQINYMLGESELSRSYVVGLDPTSPERPHHRASSCPRWTSKPVRKCGFNSLNRGGPNPHTFYGALVGGPNDIGLYEDDRKDYVSNEVATDYNAGFQSAVAGLQHFAIAGRL